MSLRSGFLLKQSPGFFSENALLEIASSQKTLLAMTKVDVFYNG